MTDVGRSPAAFSRPVEKMEEEDDFGTSGDRVLEELIRLGVVNRLPKDRIDIPDVYRLRFGVGRYRARA